MYRINTFLLTWNTAAIYIYLHIIMPMCGLLYTPHSFIHIVIKVDIGVVYLQETRKSLKYYNNLLEIHMFDLRIIILTW